MERPIKARLHIMSPVHIGCDDVYEPTSFRIDENRKKLIEFDPMDFIKALPDADRQKFTDYCMRGDISSIVNIYKFISGKQVKGREVEIADGLLEHYKKVITLSNRDEKKIKQELNQFAISRTAYNSHNNLPYIPGSSLKGAIRTAYLSKLAMNREIKGRKDKAKDLEVDLLGGRFETDPFRMVKPSDFLPVGDVKTKIMYAVNKKKKTSKFEARGPFQIFETIKEGAVFEGTIHIQQPQPTAGIKNPIQLEELLKSTHFFYRKIVNEEDEVTKNIGAGSIVVNSIVSKFKEKRGESAFLLRIGRHSGAEAVTIEGNRDIKIMQGKGQQPKYLDHATTFWLASETSKPNANIGLVPFGWAVLETVS